MKIVVDIPDTSEEVSITVRFFDAITNQMYTDVKYLYRDEILSKKCFTLDPFLSLDPSEEDD